jgi:transposase
MTQQTTAETIATIGIHLGTNTFHLIGMDARGKIVLRRKIARGQLQSCLANVPVCLIGLEACTGAHHVAVSLPLSVMTFACCRPSTSNRFCLDGVFGLSPICNGNG